MALPATDTLIGSGQNLTAANWASLVGASPVREATGLRGAVAFEIERCIWTSDVWPDDQYAKAQLLTIPILGINGPGVRLGGAGTGYAAICSTGTTSGLYRLDPTAVKLVEYSLWITGDIPEIQVTGSDVRLYKNGVLVASAVDATYASGAAGLVTFGFAVTDTILKNWEAGTLAPPPPVVIPPTLGTLSTGGRYVLIEDAIYSLPPRVVRIAYLTGGGTLEYSNDGNTWSAVTLDNNKEVVLSSKMLRSTGADSYITVKRR